MKKLKYIFNTDFHKRADTITEREQLKIFEIYFALIIRSSPHQDMFKNLEKLRKI